MLSPSPPRRRLVVARRLGLFAGLAAVFACKSLAQRGLENVWVLYTGYRYQWDASINGWALALVGIMAIGLTFVTLSGNFFLLSLKETAALSIIAFATSMSAGYGFEISFLFTVCFLNIKTVRFKEI